MQKDIHPEYREVIFLDTSTGEKFLTRSTIYAKETIEENGQEYPLVKVEISSASHPFYTGQMKYVDSAGRVDRFNKKFKNWKKPTKKTATPADSESTADE